MKRATRVAGFSLIESIIVMGLLSGFLLILATLFTTAIKGEQSSASNAAIISDGRFIMERLDYDITRASAISTPAALGSTTSSLAITIGGNTFTYALSGTNLQLTDNLGSGVLNSNRTTVSGVSFERLGNAGGKESISYSFTLTSTIKHGGITDQQTYTGAAQRR